MLKLALQLPMMLLPWALRRRVLNAVYGYRIDRGARIGFSLIGCEGFEAADAVRIGHFNLFRNLSSVKLGHAVIIGSWNWISATPRGDALHYVNQPEREPALIMHDHSSLSARHYLDCTDLVEIGAYSVIAGINTQIITHGIEIERGIQMSGPVRIGAYCFIGSRSTFLKNTALPDRSVLAAGAVVAKPLIGAFGLFGGIPAARIKELPADAAFFNRATGFVA